MVYKKSARQSVPECKRTPSYLVNERMPSRSGARLDGSHRVVMLIADYPGYRL